MTEKTYINKCSLKEKVFENGSRVLNCAFNIEELSSHAKDGWIRLVIAPRRSPNEKGYTHYCYKDSFEPKPREEPRETQEKPAKDETIPF